jgi:hypothetical protein
MRRQVSFQFLSPLALACGFAVAALAAVILFPLPMQLSMGGLYGPHMPMNGMGAGMGWPILLGGLIWLIIGAAIAGALVAATYNAIVQSSVARKSPSDEQPTS